MDYNISLIGDKIKFACEKANLTQAELAKRISIHVNSLSTYENNKRTPSLEIFTKLCLELNISTDYGLSINKILPNEKDLYNLNLNFNDYISVENLNTEQIEVINKMIGYMENSSSN